MSAIKFSGPSNPLTAPLPVDVLQSPTQCAIERFSVSGNAIVTGGTGGLGIEAVRGLLEHGAEGICIFDLAPAFENERKKLQEIYDTFPAVKFAEEVVDITDEGAIESAVERTASNLGSIDILVCFSGIARAENAENMSSKTWNDVLGINLTGSWLSAKHVGRHMIKQGTGGSIVLISSVAGHKMLYPFPISAYAVSKNGILGLTRSLGAEWAQHGIRVNSVSPGYMDTKMVRRPTLGDAMNSQLPEHTENNPMGRIGLPSELIGPIVMFCSPAGRFITGTDIIVDGGLHI